MNLKQFYQDLVDDLDVAFNHRLELQNIADEKGNFGSISDAARGADEAGDDAARGADEAGGRTYSMPEVEEERIVEQSIDEIRTQKYAGMDDVLLKQEYAVLIAGIKGNKVKFPFDKNVLALFKEMEQRGLLKEDDIIGNILVGNITMNPSVIAMQKLLSEYEIYKKKMLKDNVKIVGPDGTLKDSVPLDFVDWAIKNKKTIPTNVNSQTLLNKTSEYLDFVFLWPLRRLIGKSTEQGSFSRALLNLLLGYGGGASLGWGFYASLKSYGQAGISFLDSTPIAQKQAIKTGLKTYFTYDNPQLIIDDKTESIYGTSVDQSRQANIQFKNATPTPIFDLEIKQRQFSLDPGIVINGKTYNAFLINFGEGNFITQGSETFGNKNVLVAITRTTTAGVYTNDLKGFLAWCTTKGYTDCTYVKGKWEYKDKSGADQQGKYVDKANGWGN